MLEFLRKKQKPAGSTDMPFDESILYGYCVPMWAWVTKTDWCYGTFRLLGALLVSIICIPFCILLDMIMALCTGKS